MLVIIFVFSFNRIPHREVAWIKCDLKSNLPFFYTISNKCVDNFLCLTIFSTEQYNIHEYGVTG